MKEQRGKAKTPVKWTGPAYAVAVGRPNSLKRFDSYEEAVEFLDKHNWRKMPNSGLADVKTVKTEDSWATESNGTTDSGSEDSSTADDHAEIDSTVSNEADPDENTILSMISPKRKRDDSEDVEGQSPTQRQNVDNTMPETLYAFCNARIVPADDGKENMMMLCTFPNHSEWDVQQNVRSADNNVLQAGLLAVEEALKRANREDPECKADLTIFTVGWQLFDALNEHDRKEVENRDVLQNIMEEKGGRNLNVCRLQDGFELRGPRNPSNA
ncbi:hypothetical protein V7S43_012785 [Phytophthora oleae]|uniref:Uncharacterized protein n=1 Tax=Phytophthora oleae TaxID=2107226 RepID=A0ABD3F5J2_9STRA